MGVRRVQSLKQALPMRHVSFHVVEEGVVANRFFVHRTLGLTPEADPSNSHEFHEYILGEEIIISVAVHNSNMIASSWFLSATAHQYLPTRASPYAPGERLIRSRTHAYVTSLILFYVLLCAYVLQNFGYTSSSAFGDDAMGYTVYGGDASASGIYTARVYPWAFADVEFTLTAERNGETVWVEDIMWYGADLNSLSFFGWDETPSPFGDFFVTLDSVPAC